MKKIFKYLGLTAALSLLFASCAQEKINHPSEAGIPDATTVEPVITVDQETNHVLFTLPAGTKGVMPVWLFQDKTGEWTQYSSVNGLRKLYSAAGDYVVRMHLLNSNGMSPNYVEKTFHIDNTLVNFDKFNTMLAGSESKVWRINNNEAGHLGCGPAGTNGLEWWSANPDDKKDWGVYDNRMTFTLEGNVYSFDPGAAGTIYVNTGITSDPYNAYNTNDGQDYLYPVEAQTAEWKWEVEGEDLYLVLPENTYWPYYANVEFIANPRMKVESISTKAVDLIIDNGAIAWHFKLTSQAEEVPVVFTGFNYDHAANIWKPADAEHTYYQFHASGNDWASLPNPEVSQDGSKYSFTLADATTMQWQAQFHIIPTNALALEASKNYDFSCVLTSSTDLGSATIKVTDTASDDNFLFAETVSLKALEEHIFYLSDIKGIDAASIKLVFDFGGNAAGTEISVEKITLKDHSVDDGTVLPNNPDAPVVVPEEYNYNHEANIWKPADANHTYSQYYAPGWSQIADAEVVQDGAKYTITYPAATTQQWQAQFFIIPTNPIALEAAKNYDFSCVLTSSTDHGNVTIKLTDTASDDNFLFTQNVKLNAFEDYIFELSDIKGIDAAGVKMVFDFGGNADNTEITIKNITLKDHSVDDGTHKRGSTPDAPGLDTSGKDIWDNSKVSLTWWYSAADWSGALTPTISDITGGKKVIIPEGIGGSEWMGQTHFTLDAGITTTKKYDFCVTLNSSASCTCTVKLACEGKDNTDEGTVKYDGNVALEAYEDYQYILSGFSPIIDFEKVALFIDLGRTPAGTEVEIKDIHLYEH